MLVTQRHALTVMLERQILTVTQQLRVSNVMLDNIQREMLSHALIASLVVLTSTWIQPPTASCAQLVGILLHGL